MLGTKNSCAYSDFSTEDNVVVDSKMHIGEMGQTIPLKVSKHKNFLIALKASVWHKSKGWKAPSQHLTFS